MHRARRPPWLRWLLVGLVAWVCPAPARGEGQDTAAGRVRWLPGAAEEGARVAAIWPALVAEVGARLALSPAVGDAEVVVVRGAQALREQARVDAPGWAAAVTVGGQRVVVRADLPQTALASLEQTLRHEAVHLIWARHAGPRAWLLPRWFEEGLAEVVGGGISVSAGAQLEVAAALGHLLPFEDLERGFPASAADADLAYQQSRRWVEHLVGRIGWPDLGRVLVELLAGPSGESASQALSRALRTVTLHDLGEWHGEWRLTFRERGSRWWLWFLTDLGGVLLAVLALIAGLTFASLRRRRQRQIASLPDGPDSPVGAGRAQPGSLGGSDLEEPGTGA